MREIHLAYFARAGTGEGAFFVAEQFVFDESFGDCCAVQRDERLVAPGGEMVNGARE